MNKELYSDIVAELTNFEHSDEDPEMTDAAWAYVFYALLCRVKNEVDIENEIEREENKMFTKSDLRNGDVCIRRNGMRRVYIDTGNFQVITGFGNVEGFGALSELTDDLRGKRERNMDIVEVLRPEFPIAFLGIWGTEIDRSNFETVFKRKPDPVEMTLAEVCKALGKEIKIVKEH